MLCVFRLVRAAAETSLSLLSSASPAAKQDVAAARQSGPGSVLFDADWPRSSIEIWLDVWITVRSTEYFVRVQNKIPRQHAHKGAWGAGRITSHRWVDAGDAMGAVAQQFPVNCCHCVPVRGCTRHHSHIQRSILGPHPTLRHPALLCCCNELPHSTPAAHRMPWIRHLHSLTADEQRATPLPKLFDGDKCPILGELVPSTHRLRLSTSLHPGYDASRTCQPQVQPLHARANQWPSDWEALSLQTRRRVSPGPAAWVPYDEVRTCLGWAPCSRPAQLVRPRSRWKAVYNTLPAGP